MLRIYSTQLTDALKEGSTSWYRNLNPGYSWSGSMDSPSVKLHTKFYLQVEKLNGLFQYLKCSLGKNLIGIVFKILWFQKYFIYCPRALSVFLFVMCLVKLWKPTCPLARKNTQTQNKNSFNCAHLHLYSLYYLHIHVS